MAKATANETQTEGVVAESATATPETGKESVADHVVEAVIDSLPEPVHTIAETIWAFVAKVHILHDHVRYAPGDPMFGISEEAGRLLENRGDVVYKEVTIDAN